MIQSLSLVKRMETNTNTGKKRNIDLQQNFNECEKNNVNKSEQVGGTIQQKFEFSQPFRLIFEWFAQHCDSGCLRMGQC